MQVLNNKSFHDSSTTNFGIRKIKLGNASIDCQIYPYPRGIWNLFLIVQKAIIFLRDSKIQPSTFTKPRVAIRLNFTWNFLFHPNAIVLKPPSPSLPIYLFYIKGLSIEQFETLLPREHPLLNHNGFEHLNAWVLLTTGKREAVILIFLKGIGHLFTKEGKLQVNGDGCVPFTQRGVNIQGDFGEAWKGFCVYSKK